MEQNIDPTPKEFDLGDTFITIGCYRETGRLNRVLNVFQYALELAQENNGSGQRLISSIISLHDSKGNLSVVWRSLSAFKEFGETIEDSWAAHNECYVSHGGPNGENYVSLTAEYQSKNVTRRAP